ncbi:hypothetical protein Tco_0630218 [Tanacetum coccineum]
MPPPAALLPSSTRSPTFTTPPSSLPPSPRHHCHHLQLHLHDTTFITNNHPTTTAAINDRHHTTADLYRRSTISSFITTSPPPSPFSRHPHHGCVRFLSPPQGVRLATKPTQASKGKGIKTSAKGVIPAKKKQSAKKSKSLTILYEVALTEAEQMKIALERSKIQTHSSHASGSGADEGTGITLEVPNVPTYEYDVEQISWNSSDEEDDDEAGMHDDSDDDNNDDNEDDTKNQDDDDQVHNDQVHDDQDDEEQDDVNELTDSDNNGDDFVHPKLSTHDEEDKKEEDSDPRVHTPSNYESTDDEESDEEIQGADVKGEEMDEEETNEEDEANELCRDMNVNLEGRDTDMTDAPRIIVQTTQVIEDTHVIITPVNPEAQQQSSFVSSGFISNMLNPSPDTGIDSIFNLNTKSTSLIDVSVTTIAEPPLLSTITLPPPPTPLITHLQQTPVPTPANVPSSSLQDLPNFGSLFRFDHRLKTLETDFSELKQTNKFAATVSLIPDIVDAYLANKMSKAVKTVVQLQSHRLRDEAQAENEDFINKLDDNIKKILKDQTSHAVAANLSELELKKILIDKMQSNKSIHRFDEQKNLYKALVDAYESDKLILDTYGDNVSFKRRRDDEDKDEEPSAGSNRGSKRRRTGKEPDSTSAPKEKTSKTTGMSTESNLARKEDPRESFDELMDTPLDFSTFVMNRLNVDTLTPELLVGLTFELMKGTYKSLVKLEYFFEEVYKATTEKLDWNNPEGQQYPHDLRKPLPLIPNSRGRQVIPFDYFINNDLVESARDVYFRCRIIAVIKLQIVEWHGYKHLDWITVRRDNAKLYTFKEGDFKRLRLQDIEDLLILLVQGKLTNPNVEERLAFSVSLRMFTRSIVIQRRVENLQLGVESYQNKLNVTKLDTYKSDLKRREAYLAYSNPRGFIYQNKDKKNKLMRVDELHKFSDRSLNDVRTALDGRLKGIRMEYLPLGN